MKGPLPRNLPGIRPGGKPGKGGKPLFPAFLALLAAFASHGGAQGVPAALFRPSEKARKAALAVLLRRGDPRAGPALVKFLEKEKSPLLRKAALEVIRAVFPTDQAGPLEGLARKERDPALKKVMEDTARRLRRARELDRPSFRPCSLAPSPEDLASLADFLGKRRLVARYQGPRRKGERVLVRAWSPRVGLWFPRGPAARRKGWGYRAFPPRFARAGPGGSVSFPVPGGPLVVAAWTPRALAWTWVPASERSVTLRAPREKWGDLGKWKGRAAFLEAWPSGPWPGPGFPAWRIPASGRFRFFCPRDRPLDLLVRVLPMDPGGPLSSRYPGLLAFLRGVGEGAVRVGRLGTLSVAGASRGRIRALWVDLSPGLRPDLARRIPFPPGGGLLALSEGPWKASLGWVARDAGILLFHPRGLQVKAGRRLGLSTLPLRTSVYFLPERRLGLVKGAWTMGALFRTPGGSVLRSFVPGKGGEGILLRGFRRILPVLSVETDRLGRASACGSFSSLTGPGRLDWKVLAPFLAGPPPLVRSQSLHVFRGKRFLLEGPSVLERAAFPFLAMADRAFQVASRVVTGRSPSWGKVPVLAHNFLPPGVGASAGGGAARAGRMNFLLHDLLSVALPSDALVLPWVHEQGHKLGYPHDPGMSAQTVETLWSLVGEEGVECSGRFACPGAWDLAAGRRRGKGRALLEAFSLYRRRFGGEPLRRFLHIQERCRWLLEGEGLSETASDVAALSCVAGKRVDGWFRALGWNAPAHEVEKGLAILAERTSLPPSGLSKALGEFRAALREGKDPRLVWKKLLAIRTHRERALAALAAARRLRSRLARSQWKAFLLEALRAGARAIPDTGRSVRRRALAAWVTP